MERRTRKATVRLTEEELARLKEAARRAGWSQEAYLRALIGGIDPRPKPPPDYLAMTRELHAIGNNLNQIARKAHALGTVDAAPTTPRREGSKPRSARSWRRSKSREGGDEVAVTSIWKVEGRLARVLGYAGNPDKAEGSPDEWELQGVGAAILYAADPGKTERQLYVTGVNCLPATALEEMNATKRQYGKTGGIVAFHGYQAFAPGETDPATAHEVGVALAQELWGGRFEVVVATHLDKAHLHNHFVVNSVSFADGRRFHRDAACYRAMREASDELCREHGLSVVESPGRGGARHHAEWRAEREGRPTWRSLVKADVDEAVGRAASMRQFHANLRAMGYDVKVGKDISVRPPGKERFVRLRRNFGDAYSQEGIGARILANSRQRLPLGRPRPAPKERPPVPKGTLVSLYRRYMALLNGAKRQRAPGGRAHFLLREDLRELEAISGELALLAREGIETRSQLAAYERALADKSEALQAERRALRNEARRSKAAGSPAPPNPRIAEIASELRGARREARACARIRARSAELPARIAQIEGAEANREERQVEGHGRIERGC